MNARLEGKRADEQQVALAPLDRFQRRLLNVGVAHSAELRADGHAHGRSSVRLALGVDVFAWEGVEPGEGDALLLAPCPVAGEAVVLDAEGRPRFQLLQNRGGSKEGTLVYEVFDLLYLDGHDLRGLPLRRRKEILSQIIDLPNVRVSEHIEQHGRDFYGVVAEQG